MGKVLTVDDSEPMRKLVGMVLGSIGHQVTTACNGAEALLRMNEQNFDLLVTDINMPVLSGTQLIEQIRKMNQDLPILVLTTENQHEMQQAGKAIGANGWVKKPFQPNQYAEMVRRLLD